MAGRNQNNASSPARPEPRGFDVFNDDDIAELVSAFRRQRSLGTIIRDDNNLIRIDYLHALRRFQRCDERVYRLTVDPSVITSLGDFLRHLRNILGYFINLAKIQSSSANDRARLYFDRAPVSPFSTAVIFINV